MSTATQQYDGHGIALESHDTDGAPATHRHALRTLCSAVADDDHLGIGDVFHDDGTTYVPIVLESPHGDVHTRSLDVWLRNHPVEWQLQVNSVFNSDEVTEVTVELV